MSLLAKAMAVRPSKKIATSVDHEELELALAFVLRTVTASQAAAVLDIWPSNVPSWAAIVIRDGLDAGAISIVRTPAVETVE